MDAGFDYITATSTPKREDWHDFNAVALAFVSGMEQEGHTVTEVRQNGYEGYKCGETFFGTREDSAIWKTSGGLSRNVAQFAKAHSLAPNITRADLQLTFEPETDGVRDVGAMFRAVHEPLVEDAAIRARTKAAFYGSSLCTGFTLGNRASQTYLRAYLAGVKHPERYRSDAVRFEVEWKSERANQVWQLYGNAVDDAVLAGTYVASEFLKYGVNEPMQAQMSACKLPELGRSGSNEKTVNWLVTTVAKTVEKLVRAGYGEQLRPVFLEALYPKASLVRTSETLEADKLAFPVRT